MTIMKRSLKRHDRSSSSFKATALCHKKLQSRPSYMMLQTSRYDLLHSWNKTAARLDLVDPEIMTDDFSIFLEDWPQMKHKFTCYEVLKDVTHSQHMSFDVIYALTSTHTVLEWQFKDNGREIRVNNFRFPVMLRTMIFIKENRVYVGLDQNGNLLILFYAEPKDRIEILKQVDSAYNAKCLVFIKETRQVVVGGNGYLKSYALHQGKEQSTNMDSAKQIETSLGEHERIYALAVDPMNHRLLAMTESSLILVDYMTMREIKRFSEKEDPFAIITCCCIYGKNEYFVTGNSRSVVRIWNPTLITEIHAYRCHRGKITALAPYSAKALLFSSSEDGWVYIWRMDVFKEPLQRVKVADNILTMGMTNEHGKMGFWCFTRDSVVVYEHDMFCMPFAYMDSTVYKLQRLYAYDVHPNRIMVATEDGGMRHLNPVTGNFIGYMFPMTSLHLVQKLAYNAFRRRTYMVMGEGSVLVLNCDKSPFRGLEVHQPAAAEDAVTCVMAGMLSLGEELEDIIVFAGYKNGQIHIMASDAFVMLRPVQAHHSLVECMELMSEVSPTRDEVYPSITTMVSAGADYAVKVWKLQCTPKPRTGLELSLQLLLQIRCHTTPKYVAATTDRIAVVYFANNLLDMYNINPNDSSSASYPLARLTHTRDYDHTHTITSLQKCALLRIFATGSMDCTIKLWNDQNELIRELIFLTPVVDCCFATDHGDLLFASEKVIRSVSPDKYLPWAYLKRMKNTNFRTKELREMTMSYEVSLKSWIDPSRVRQKTLTHKYGWQADKLKRRCVNTEEWEIAWYAGKSRGTTVTIQIPSIRRPRIPRDLSAPYAAELLERRKFRVTPMVSLVMPHEGSLMNMAEQDRAKEEGSVSSSYHSESTHSLASGDTLLASGESAEPTDTTHFSVDYAPTRTKKTRKAQKEEEGKRLRLVSFAAKLERRKKMREELETKDGSKADQAEVQSTSLDETTSIPVTAEDMDLSEDAKCMLEGLDVLDSFPKAYNILRTGVDDLPLEDVASAASIVVEEPDVEREDVSPLGIGLRQRETLRQYMVRHGYGIFTKLPETKLSCIMTHLNDAMEQVLDSDMDPTQRMFLLNFGSCFREAILKSEGSDVDELADRCFREAFKSHMKQGSAFYKSKAKGQSTDQQLQQPELTVLEALQKKLESGGQKKPSKIKKTLGLRFAPPVLIHRLQDSDKSPSDLSRLSIMDSSLDSIRRFSEWSSTTQLDVADDSRAQRLSVSQIKTYADDLGAALDQVRQQSWFPKDVPLEAFATCQAWANVLGSMMTSQSLLPAVLFTGSVVGSGELSENMNEMLLKALKQLIQQLPPGEAEGLLSRLSNMLSQEQIKTIAGDLLRQTTDALSPGKAGPVAKRSREDRVSRTRIDRGQRPSQTAPTLRVVSREEKEPVKEPVKKREKETLMEPIQEPVQEPVTEPEKEPEKEPERSPLPADLPAVPLPAVPLPPLPPIPSKPPTKTRPKRMPIAKPLTMAKRTEAEEEVPEPESVAITPTETSPLPQAESDASETSSGRATKDSFVYRHAKSMLAGETSVKKQLPSQESKSTGEGIDDTKGKKLLKDRRSEDGKSTQLERPKKIKSAQSDSAERLHKTKFFKSGNRFSVLLDSVKDRADVRKTTLKQIKEKEGAAPEQYVTEEESMVTIASRQSLSTQSDIKVEEAAVISVRVSPTDKLLLSDDKIAGVVQRSKHKQRSRPEEKGKQALKITEHKFTFLEETLIDSLKDVTTIIRESELGKDKMSDTQAAKKSPQPAKTATSVAHKTDTARTLIDTVTDLSSSRELSSSVEMKSNVSFSTFEQILAEAQTKLEGKERDQKGRLESHEMLSPVDKVERHPDQEGRGPEAELPTEFKPRQDDLVPQLEKEEQVKKKAAEDDEVFISHEVDLSGLSESLVQKEISLESSISKGAVSSTQDVDVVTEISKESREYMPVLLPSTQDVDVVTETSKESREYMPVLLPSTQDVDVVTEISKESREYMPVLLPSTQDVDVVTETPKESREYMPVLLPSTQDVDVVTETSKESREYMPVLLPSTQDVDVVTETSKESREYMPVLLPSTQDVDAVTETSKESREYMPVLLPSTQDVDVVTETPKESREYMPVLSISQPSQQEVERGQQQTLPGVFEEAQAEVPSGVQHLIDSSSVRLPSPSFGQVPPSTPALSFFVEKELQQKPQKMVQIDESAEQLSPRPSSLPELERYMEEKFGLTTKDRTLLETQKSTIKAELSKSEQVTAKTKRLLFLCDKYDPKRVADTKEAGTDTDRHPKEMIIKKLSRPKKGKEIHKRQHVLEKHEVEQYVEPRKVNVPVTLWNKKILNAYRKVWKVSPVCPELGHKMKKAVSQDQRQKLSGGKEKQSRAVCPEDTEALQRRIKNETDLLSLLQLQRMMSSCVWTKGEAGLRVARGATVRSRRFRPPRMVPSDVIMALDGRLGMITTHREFGESRYGKLSLQWTTKVPCIPVEGLEKRVRELEQRDLHHRQAVSRVPPGLVRSSSAVAAAMSATDTGGAEPASEHFSSGRITVTSSVHIHKKSEMKLPSIVAPLSTKAIDKEGSFLPTILQHSSLAVMPKSVQDDVMYRLGMKLR